MVLPRRTPELLEADEAQSFVHKLQLSVSGGLPHAVPVPGLRTEEHELVKAVFQVLQGFETSWFYWDSDVPWYHEKAGIYVAHLSLTGLRSLLSPFLFTATCLKQVELFVGKVRMQHHKIPTLDAFASSVDSWLKSKIPMTVVILLTSEAPQSSSEGGRTAICFSQQDYNSAGIN